MNLKYLTVLACGVALLSVSTIVKAQSSPKRVTSAVTRTKCAESARQATLTDLTQEIALMEVEKVLLKINFTQDHPQFALLNERQLGLEACLTRLQPNDNRDLVVATTVRALESKLIELEAQYTSDSIKYFDDHPTQQLRKVQIKALRQHLTTLL
ncbi:hypothetical protein H6F61_26390 [Cyanobacteria bacterium FACHB-472]|nr:hypothetical protein [Cyanobacteria bacterium FACHB-472]